MKTFVVRLYVPAEPRPVGTTLCGVVEEVASDRQASFAGGQDLLAFLAATEGAEGVEPTERSS